MLGVFVFKILEFIINQIINQRVFIMYKSVTLLFPGQGSQYVGMGQKLKDDENYALFENANKVLGYPLSKIMFEGPIEDLTSTQNTQPAILTHSVALFRKLNKILQANNIKIDQVLGHSVGEYAALVAAGALSLEDATMAVHLRGKYMQEAVPHGKGKMFAMMRISPEDVKKACEAVSTDEHQAMPANFNEPGQTVISGDATACDKAVEWAQTNIGGRFRAVELKVSAPFHSSLMKPAATNLEKAFSKFKFTEISIPYIANINANKYESGTTPETVRKNLIDQVCGSVLWSQSIEQLPDDTLAIEVGPGRVLAGLVKKINSNIKVLSLDQDSTFTQLEELISCK